MKYVYGRDPPYELYNFTGAVLDVSITAYPFPVSTSGTKVYSLTFTETRPYPKFKSTYKYIMHFVQSELFFSRKATTTLFSIG